MTLPVPAFVLAAAAFIVYGAVLWALDIYTPPEVRHWERLAELRGLQSSQGLGDRLGGHLPLLGRLREEVDIGLLLLVSGSFQTSESWLVGTAAWSLAGAAGVSAVEAAGLLLQGWLPLPLWVALAVLPLIATLRYVRLRGRARRRQAKVADQLADSLLGLAILVPGMPPEDALGLLARCQRESALAQVLEEGSLARLLGEGASLRSTRERYSLVGKALRIPLFQELAQVMRGIESEGLSPGEEYPALSRISAQSRLAQNRLRVARAKTGAAAAIALLLVPLLIMVGGGIAFAFLGSVNG
ncbi:MAG: hypothetical protein ABR573_08765 [Candidatus Dormibacteria bacterium]